MADNEEQKIVEEAVDRVVEEVQSESQEVKQERPEINYQREIERRKGEAERLRQELEVERSKQVKRYDPNDISTWGDNELVALKNSQDPNHTQYRQKAEDELFDRKMQRVLERERLNTKRTNSELELRTKYPEALDPSSDFAAKMEQIMYDLDLQKSPAGRLAAARIVAGESSKGSSKANAAGRKAEEARLKDVKSNFSEGDRPDPRQNMPNPKKTEDLIKKINDAKDIDGSARAMGELLKGKGIDPKTFFNR